MRNEIWQNFLFTFFTTTSQQRLHLPTLNTTHFQLSFCNPAIASFLRQFRRYGSRKGRISQFTTAAAGFSTSLYSTRAWISLHPSNGDGSSNHCSSCGRWGAIPIREWVEFCATSACAYCLRYQKWRFPPFLQCIRDVLKVTISLQQNMDHVGL